MALWIVIAVVVLIVLILIGYFISLYNNLVSVKNNVDKAFSNIDVLLKQRHDELPKLIDACKEYMGYEKGTLMQVTEARTQVDQARKSGDMAKLGVAETVMRKSVGSLFALAENYPDLKANASFQQLQSRISDLENQIADRREFYNDSVNVFNIAIEQFPSNMVAGHFHYQRKEVLKFDSSETTDVDIKDMFKS